MNTKFESGRKEASTLRTVSIISSIALAVTAFITLAIGVCTPPISGPFSTGTSIKYTLYRYPFSLS